jgi:hypothetical protein
MRNRVLVVLAVIAVLFAACNGHVQRRPVPAITTDTLHYKYQEIKERADDCGPVNNKQGCSIADINYPVFESQPALNDTITKKLLRLFDNDPDKDLQAMAKNFIGDYDEYKKVQKHKPPQPFSLNLNAKVTRQDSNLVTIEVDGSSLSGNVHPVAQTQFINWNAKAQKEITLQDIFQPNTIEPLTHIAEKIFRKQENLKDTASLAGDYFFKGGRFSLNRNFSITPLGIRFFYNQYEIKPYAAGTTDLFIPYSQIKTLLRPNTVVSQYIK